MSSEHSDQQALEQDIQRVTAGKLAREHTVLNDLAKTLPRANTAFQHDLQARLLAQLQHSTDKQETIPMMTLPFPRVTRPQHRKTAPLAFLTAVASVVLLCGLAFSLRGRNLLTVFLDKTPVNQQQTLIPASEFWSLVVARQDIPYGTIISADMLTTVMWTKGQQQQALEQHPEWGGFYQTVDAVVGKVASLSIAPLMPITTASTVDNNGCALSYASFQCLSSVPLPDGYTTTGLASTDDIIQNFRAGDHVDILSLVDDQIVTLVEDVLLVTLPTDSHPNVTFAAGNWKQTVLGALYRDGKPYMLRLHRTLADTSALSTDTRALVITLHDPIPLNFKPYLMVSISDTLAYRLVDAPYSLDDTHFTASGDTMNFWYENRPILQITGNGKGSDVTFEMSKADADNILYLIEQGATLNMAGSGSDPLTPVDDAFAVVLPSQGLKTPIDGLAVAQQAQLTLTVNLGDIAHPSDLPATLANGTLQTAVTISQVGAFRMIDNTTEKPLILSFEGVRVMMGYDESQAIEWLTAHQVAFEYRLEPIVK